MRAAWIVLAVLLVALVATAAASPATPLMPFQAIQGRTAAGVLEFTVMSGPTADRQILAFPLDGKIVLVELVPFVMEPVPQPGPTPTPPTPPTPPVPPVPVAKPIWVTVVHESAQQTPAQAAVLNSKALRDLIAANKGHWRVIDKDQQGVDLKPYIDRAAGKMPLVIVCDDSGSVLGEYPLPVTEAEMVARVKALGGWQ